MIILEPRLAFLDLFKRHREEIYQGKKLNLIIIKLVTIQIFMIQFELFYYLLYK